MLSPRNQPCSRAHSAPREPAPRQTPHLSCGNRDRGDGAGSGVRIAYSVIHSPPSSLARSWAATMIRPRSRWGHEPAEKIPDDRMCVAPSCGRRPSSPFAHVGPWFEGIMGNPPAVSQSSCCAGLPSFREDAQRSPCGLPVQSPTELAETAHRVDTAAGVAAGSVMAPAALRLAVVDRGSRSTSRNRSQSSAADLDSTGAARSDVSPQLRRDRPRPFRTSETGRSGSRTGSDRVGPRPPATHRASTQAR